MGINKNQGEGEVLHSLEVWVILLKMEVFRLLSLLRMTLHVAHKVGAHLVLPDIQHFLVHLREGGREVVNGQRERAGGRL